MVMNLPEILWLLPLLITASVYSIYGVLALTLGNGSKSVARKNTSYRPFVSILIPSYNEQEIMQAKLENTIETLYPQDRIEIVVMDSSSDSTPEIVNEFSRRYPFIKLIHEKERNGVANALNKAYRAVTGDIVVRTDCDSRLNKHSISEIVSNFADPTIGAATGRLIVLNKEMKELRYRTLQQRIQMAESKIDSTYIFQPFSAFRRELIRLIDPKSIADDAEVALNIRTQGYRAIYDPQAEFYEASPDKFAERLKLKSRRAQGHIKLLLKNVRLCFNSKLSSYGLLVLPMNFFMIVISPLMMILIPSLFVLDLLTIRSFIILDSIGLVLLACVALLRNKKMISSIWTIMELQYAQLIALKNLITGVEQHVWKKQESLRKHYVTQ
jgi:cellulose synthase/poly-beta-1,6-N-acetylglucosamine synthase-like glycosyltransferase